VTSNLPAKAKLTLVNLNITSKITRLLLQADNKFKTSKPFLKFTTKFTKSGGNVLESYLKR